MNIQYIKSNISNTSQDSLVKLLYDIILQDINNVEDYIPGNSYIKGDRVYLQENGKHQIYQCISDTSSNRFNKDEWRYIMEVFDGNVEKFYNLKIQEEVHIITEDTRNGIVTKLNFDETRSTLAIYKGKKRYCTKYDFILSDKEITFKNPFNIGDRLILEVKENLGMSLTISVVFYDIEGNPYNVAISNTGIVSVQRASNTSPSDIKYTELVTGEHTYTMMVDSSVNPPTLGLFKDIETYITGTNDKVYKVDIIYDTLTLEEVNYRVGDAYTDTKIVMGSDRRFYTLSVINDNIVATEVVDDSLNPSDFEIGIKVISKEFKNRMIDINNGVVNVRPYINNGGFHNILLRSGETDVVRLSINDDLSLSMDEGYESNPNRTSTRLLDYFYFFDNNWDYYRLFIENGELIYEPCETIIIPDSKGINMLTPSGEMVKLVLPSIDSDLYINKVINLSNTGTFESPIEGFVVMINNNKKLVTVNTKTNGFEIVDTNERFRTNHHYIMSEDKKLYKLDVSDNNVRFIEQDIDEFDVECVNIGTFIKSNEMITRIDIVDGETILKPISTFTHRIKSDDGKSFILDVEGNKSNETITFREVQDDPFSSSVGSGELYLEDNNGRHYKANISNDGNLRFIELTKEIDIDYDITSLVYSSIGWYKLNLDNYNLKLTKIFDNMYENKMSYGNIVKKDFVLSSENGTKYSLYANGNGEVNVKESKPVNVKGLVLRSDNGYVYGLGVMEDKLVSYESYITNPRVPEKLYITDVITRQQHVLFMTGDRLCSELATRNSDQSKECYAIYDAYQTEYKLEMRNNNLTIVGNSNGLILRSDNGFIYGLGVSNDRLVSYEASSLDPNVPEKLYITDTVTNDQYAIFMSGTRLCSELIVDSVEESENWYIIYDEDQNEYILEIRNGELIVVENNKGLVLRSSNGNIYSLSVMDDRLVSYETGSTNPDIPNELYITDTITNDQYVLFMIDDKLCSRLEDEPNEHSDYCYIIYDEHKNEYLLEIRNGSLIITTDDPEVEEDERTLLVKKFTRSIKIQSTDENIIVGIGGVEGIPYKEQKLEITTDEDMNDIISSIISTTKNKKGGK